MTQPSILPLSSPLSTTPEAELAAELAGTAATRRLRIAFVADTIHGDVGGAVIAGRKLVERLRERHDVTVIGTDVEASDGTRFNSFQFPLRAMREMYFVMARPERAAIARAVADADVVHLQFPFWLSFVALEEARKAGKPVVAAFHVQPENAFLQFGIRWAWLNRKVYKFWVDRLYNKVDTVVCPSPFAERRLREHGLTVPSVVVSNGVPPDVCDAPPIARVASDKATILMVGRHAAEKRQELLIEAVRRSRHRDRIHLVIAGAGHRTKALQKLAKKLPNGAEVGFQTRERLIELLHQADLFVHCSEVELEGIAVLEALHCGLPVLVADAPESAASSFALDDDFRFPAGDVAALTERLDALLDRPAVLEAARERSRAAARNHDFGQSCDRVVEIYRSVLAPAAEAGNGHSNGHGNGNGNGNGNGHQTAPAAVADEAEVSRSSNTAVSTDGDAVAAKRCAGV